MSFNKKTLWISLTVVFLIIVALILLLRPAAPFRADWPMWGYNEGRHFSVEMNLPENPALHWVRELPEPRRAWPFQFEDYFTGGNPLGIGKLSFDVSYEPVVGGGRMYVPSMVSDKVSAYATDTGEKIWKFFADGPVRFAPVYHDEKLYFVSDDGNLYCLQANSGRLLWKYKGSYANRLVLGNERLISIWPARGGPVISDGVIYFASGILAFEGIFIHAVSAESGERIWTNSTSGAIWSLHQHGGAYSYGGPSPQGYLALSGDKLIVPGGRTPPAVYDRNTGEFLYYRQASGTVGKGAGGYRVHAHDDWFVNHDMLYALEDGAQYGEVPGTVLTDNAFIGTGTNSIVAHSVELIRTEVEIEDRLERDALREQYSIDSLWVKDGIEDIRHIHFKAGDTLGFSRDGGRAGLYRLNEEGQPDLIVWEETHESEVWNMIPADGKIFVITENGRIYCYGEKNNDRTVVYRYEPASLPDPSGADPVVRRLLQEKGINSGYSLIFEGDEELLPALADETEMHIIAVYEDERRVATLRQQFDDTGLYGHRIVIKQGNLTDLNLPSYLAELVILQGEENSSEQIRKAYELLRPYGGSLLIPNTDDDVTMLFTGDDFATLFDESELVQASLEIAGGVSVITREGALPGAGQWTHQYGGPSNRTYSDDILVKPPLGTLWFGGTSNLNALPRHHNGPIPQVAGGKLFILGVETLSARCVYTGRELWVKEIPGIGHPFTDLVFEERFRSGSEVYMPNHPGANFIGSPYVSVEDGVYVIYEENLWHLDPATGNTISEFDLPALNPMERREWGHVMVWEDLLITTAGPLYFDDSEPGKDESWNATSSSHLLVMNRHEGNILWHERAENEGFRHNAITAGNGLLFVVDGLSEGIIDSLQRRGLQPETGSSLIAFDIHSGERHWEREEDVFGTWLGYYEEEDLLIQGGRRGQRRPLPDEPRDRLSAHNGSTGEIEWIYTNEYSGPLGLHSDMIIPGRPGERAIMPSTGMPLIKQHPVTGEEYEWFYHRYYGCGTMNSSKYLIMFRSGAAGFADLLNFGGSSNLGGFRSGCTNNMVAADGVLNAPEYTRTCTCSYQLQTSLGFVHTPGIEMWSFNRLPEINKTVESLGINFGAPGNRRENGVLWLEYPKIYGAGPDSPVTVTPGQNDSFRNHATWIDNPEDGYPWVASYGATGIENIRLQLVPEPSVENHSYNITLFFAEPDQIDAGERVFDVLVQGEKYLENFDLLEHAGEPGRVYRIEMKEIPVVDELDISFVWDDRSLPSVISGIEIVRVP